MIVPTEGINMEDETSQFRQTSESSAPVILQ
jgi:hypothetical protein